jgi:prephenate dehydratase
MIHRTPVTLTGKVAFQGEPGAYGHMACVEAYPQLEPFPCPTFEDAFEAVSTGEAVRALIPIENSLAGRVSDIHHLLPDSALSIVGEHFFRVRHQLLGLPGARLDQVRSVHSHPMALGQCRKLIRQNRFLPVKEADTAGAARLVKERGDPTQAALASVLAGQIYGLDILAHDVEDAGHNTTRFIAMSAQSDDAAQDEGACVTAFVFQVRNVPAALYKAMGGFATNGVNMTKLESYQLGGTFRATQFYAEVDGHPDARAVQLALEELSFFSTELRILGVFLADPYRQDAGV